MAEVVVATRQDTVFGDRRVITADLTSVDNADTFTSGLQRVDAAHFQPLTAAAVGMTIVGGTITFANAGTLAGKLLVIGT